MPEQSFGEAWMRLLAAFKRVLFGTPANLVIAHARPNSCNLERACFSQCQHTPEQDNITRGLTWRHVLEAQLGDDAAKQSSNDLPISARLFHQESVVKGERGRNQPTVHQDTEWRILLPKLRPRQCCRLKL